ncbi:DUF721 domain-containing protein [Demequina litorisediminis]|uniref:DUF721 domain-containing protein n=1 Tax=Demequina litorisediminis TaxID=1849022 RepID=A0ABQ6IF48_9MICO|nr:DciA family protein [Demequina litorisediminis]GMA35743.1 hypothetical protein GCM10025876_19470 [Demequina litorisediminis]
MRISPARRWNGREHRPGSGGVPDLPAAARRKQEEKRRDSQPFTPGRDPQPMSDAVEALLRRMGWTEQIEVSGVMGRWRDIVGDQIADHCEPLTFDEGILTVKASSTAWATQAPDHEWSDPSPHQ